MSQEQSATQSIQRNPSRRGRPTKHAADSSSSLQNTQLQSDKKLEESQLKDSKLIIVSPSKTFKKRRNDQMSEQDKIQNAKIIQSMNKKITFLKNPRFRIVRPPIQFTDLLTKPELTLQHDDPSCPFRASPSRIEFFNYEIDKIYEIQLSVINVDKVSRRLKVLPPNLPCFSIKELKYPSPLPMSELDDKMYGNQEIGMVAPGMSIGIVVQFIIDNFQEQEDYLTVITEINAFKVPIFAKRDAPQIDLPDLLDCKSCWIGDRCVEVFKFTNKGGEGGFKFFCEEEIEDSDGETLITGNFELFPTEFYLQRGEQQEIVVTFTPRQEGEETKKIILACDNRTSASYTLKGSGNMAELIIYGIDELRVDDFKGSSEPMSKLFFEGVLPGVSKTKKLLLKNTTDVNVKFHWNIFKEQQGAIMSNKQGEDDKLSSSRKQSEWNQMFEDKDKYAFQINPIQGTFQPKQIIEFTISCLTQSPFPLFENATLFIDEVPFESIRNISEFLKSYMAKKLAIPTVIPKENLPGFVGSNSARPSVAYLNLQFLCLSSFGSVSINKPFKLFSSSLAVHQEYKDSFILTNNSLALINFEIKLGLSSNQELTLFAEQDIGTIPPNSSLEIKLGFSSGIVGENQKGILEITFDYSNSLTYEVIGNFIGPNVRLTQPLLDFGLLPVMESKSLNLILENTTSVTAEVTIRDINKKEKIKESASMKRLSQISSTLSQQFKQSDINFFNKLEEAEQALTRCELEIEESALLLQPNEKRQVVIRCQAGIPESYLTTLEISVENSKDKLYINAKAEVQQIIVSLNKIALNFDCIYVNKPLIISKDFTSNYIQIQNLSNLDAQFEWEDVSDEYTVMTIEPKKGKLKAKTNIDMKFTITALKGESVDKLMVCNVNNTKYPIGFSINSRIQGLTILLERMILEQNTNRSKDTTKLAEDNTNMFNNLILKSGIRNSRLLKSMRDTDIVRSFDDSQRLSKSSAGLTISENLQKEVVEKIEFLGCQINKPSHMYLLLSNTSGLDTTFNLQSFGFKPIEKDPISTTKNKKTLKKVNINKSTSQLGIEDASHNDSKLNDSKITSQQENSKQAEISNIIRDSENSREDVNSRQKNKELDESQISQKIKEEQSPQIIDEDFKSRISKSVQQESQMEALNRAGMVQGIEPIRPEGHQGGKRSSKGASMIDKIPLGNSDSEEEDDFGFEFQESPIVKNNKKFSQNNILSESHIASRMSHAEEKQKNSQRASVQAKTSRINTISLLTAEYEKIKNFNSKAGQELNAAKKIDKEQRICLQNEKGFAISVEPSSGSLVAHAEQIIKITLFNDISGRIEDKLILEVEGLPPKEIPTSIEVIGSPVIISPYQLGIDYKGDYPVFEIGSYMKGSGTFTREFKITNTGPKTVEVGWKVFNLNSSSSQNEQNYFNITIDDPIHGSGNMCKLSFNAISPPEATNGPFEIEPKSFIVGGREEQLFKVHYSADEARDFSSVLIAEPIVINSDGQKETSLKLESLILGLKAHSLKPLLYLDKLLNMEGSHVLKMEKWALFNNPKEYKEICLLNKEFVTVKFDLHIEGPFAIEEINSSSKTNILNSIVAKQSHGLSKSIVNESTIKNNSTLQSKSMTKKLKSTETLQKSKGLPSWMTYTLEQNQNMKIILKYQGQKVSDYEAWPITYKNYEFGKLFINFTNGDQQTIELEGHLLRPLISLNVSGHEDIAGPDVQDFGIVHINNSKNILIFLSNTSKVPAKWKLLHIKNPFKKFLASATMTKEEYENSQITDDPDVFSFDLTQGNLHGPSVPVKSLPETLSLPTLLTSTKNFQNQIIPQQIQICFKPRKNVMYKSKYRICVEEGPTVDFTLRGIGSYMEEHEK